MLRAAAGHGAREIIIGLGGSATNDGGFGLARALGFRFIGRDDRELTGPVTALLDLSRIEPPDDLSLPRITAACDVTNPLLGPHGATRTFGAQKGATPEQLETLERSLARLAEVAAQNFTTITAMSRGPGQRAALALGFSPFAARRCDRVSRWSRKRSSCAPKSSAPMSSSPAKENSIARRLLEKLQPASREWREP